MNATHLRGFGQETVAVRVRRLTVEVDPSSSSRRLLRKSADPETASPPKRILDLVLFFVDPGSFVAIMGGTGSGKTTLLNTLSGRLNLRHHLSFLGLIEYLTPNSDTPKNQISTAYLLQLDMFLPGLTVRETIDFQAALRMPRNTSEPEKLRFVDFLLDVLELSHLSNQQVTSYTGTTSLSGGEQRRLSLAIQLVSKPAVLFLDEPTTGLDAANSLKLVLVVKKLAELGITVMCAIHQPRPEVVDMFDAVCLLTRGGRLVYYGSVSDTSYFDLIPFLQSQNGDLKASNYVDYIMLLLVKDSSSPENEARTVDRINRLVDNWRMTNPVRGSSLNARQSRHYFEKIQAQFQLNRRILWIQELKVLTQRAFLLCLRDRMLLLAFVGGIIVIGGGFGWLFIRPKHDLAGMRLYLAALYTTLQVIGFTPMFVEIERLWGPDGQNFFREYTEGVVLIPGFVILRRLGRLFPEDLPITIIWTVITFFMWGLRGGVGHFFVYFLLSFLTELLGMTLALVCFAIGPQFAVLALALNVYYQVQNSSCGFFVNLRTMPVYVRWLKYCAFFWYSYGAMIWNQFNGWVGDCPYLSPEECTTYTGAYQIETLGFPKNFLWQQVGICIAWILLYAILAVLALKFVKNYDMQIATTKKNRFAGDHQHSLFPPFDVKIEFSDDTRVDKRTIDFTIGIKDTTLTALPAWFERLTTHKEPKILLRSISSEFSAKTLNVIMGPLGSGKTTLLNYLSHRLPRSSNLSANGEVTLNGVRLSTKQLSEVLAYVAQHDRTLIPALTVRETLHFQARLRLPPKDYSRLTQIVNDLLRKMGLIDCADTVIGSDSVKGISGGEKRRVLIAVQLLDKPHILFLDEPTLGLDSSTALAVLRLLHQLADEGTTVVLTVHQPSMEMVEMFNSVLLLARGGQVVYDGSASNMPRYFAEQGFIAPKNGNPTDFYLDLLLRQLDETAEQAQLRIAQLVTAWQKLSRVGSVSYTDKIDLRQFRREKTSFQNTMMTIMKRQTLATFRTPDVLFTRGFQGVALAIFYTLFFAPLKNQRDGVDNRLGLIQSLLNMYFVGLLNNVSLYPVERGIFYQEYKDGIYGSVQYCLAYFINEVPFEVFQCILFLALCVFGIGMPRTVSMFFVNLLTMFVTVNCGELVGLMWNLLFDHLGFATNLMSICLLFAVFMGGTMSMHLPGFFQGINWINPMKYVVRCNALLIFENQEFHCGDIPCQFDRGAQVLSYFDLNGNLAKNIGAIIACLVAYRVVAIMLCVVKVNYFI